MKSTLLSIIGLFLLNASTLCAQVFTAYQIPTGTIGNQQLPASETQSMGNDFDVNTPIQILSLGVFDSGGNGILGTLVARIYNRDTQTSLASISFSGNAGTLVGGSRFLNLATPLTLNSGFHGIISVAYTGFPTLEADGNLRAGPGNWTTGSGGGLISFVGAGHNSFMGTGDVFPNLFSDGLAPDNFAAGTFTFTAVPEPTSLTLTIMSLIIFSAGSFRRMGACQSRTNCN